MNNKEKQIVVCVAPHPDDETLGCGGTLLKHVAQGHDVHWLIVTCMSDPPFSAARISQREEEIKKVAKAYGFAGVHRLDFISTLLDTIPLSKIIEKMGEVFQELQPTIAYVPYRGDVHSDHAIVFDAASACSKWFRYPSLSRVLAYETPSESDFDINPNSRGFRPNVFVDIGPWLSKKLEIMRCFLGEQGGFPFPRSDESLACLAKVRGSASGFLASEAFMLLRERI